MTVQLYRHFDQAGTLLYVGISIHAWNRLRAHRSAKWFSQISRIEIEAHPTRADALSAEIAVIQNENPQYNITGRQITAPLYSALTDEQRRTSRECPRCFKYRQAKRIAMGKWRKNKRAEPTEKE